MGCGRHHDMSCAEVLRRVYEYLDGELDTVHLGKVQQHLAECGPCLREFGVEEEVKTLVRRACRHEAVPAALRERVLYSIHAGSTTTSTTTTGSATSVSSTMSVEVRYRPER